MSHTSKLIIKVSFLACLLAIAIPGISMPDGKGMHGGHHGKGMQGGKHHLWKSLTAKQKTEIMALKYTFKSKKLLLKARMKQLKVELAMSLANDKPDRKAIDKKVDSILALKKKMISAKLDFKIAFRKLLTKEQKAMFDLKMLKKMYKGKKSCRFHR